jgi:dUTP pyrophosphatase
MGAKGLIIPNSPGLIDSGYRGEIKVLLFNLKDSVYKINAGDKIAQLVIMRHEEVRPTELSNLPESQDGRGDGGFGSSGK